MSLCRGKQKKLLANIILAAERLFAPAKHNLSWRRKQMTFTLVYTYLVKTEFCRLAGVKPTGDGFVRLFQSSVSWVSRFHTIPNFMFRSLKNRHIRGLLYLFSDSRQRHLTSVCTWRPSMGCMRIPATRSSGRLWRYVNGHNNKMIMKRTIYWCWTMMLIV